MGTSAIALVGQHDLDVVLTDLMMPGSDGIAVLRHIRDVSPQTLVILMTAHASVETALEAIRLGAQDYLLKPLIFEDVLRKVQHLMSHRKMAWENQLLRREVNGQFSPDRPLGRSPAMQEISVLVREVAPAPTTVLLTGESGVGKEVVARAIHLQSPRKDKVFLPVNCSAIPETLLESQLFGYVKGAFTGAGELSGRAFPARSRVARSSSTRSARCRSVCSRKFLGRSRRQRSSAHRFHSSGAAQRANYRGDQP